MGLVGNRRVAGGVCIAALGLAIASILGGVAAAGPVQESGYWWRLQTGTGPRLTPPQVPAGGLWVTRESFGRRVGVRGAHHARGGRSRDSAHIVDRQRERHACARCLSGCLRVVAGPGRQLERQARRRLREVAGPRGGLARPHDAHRVAQRLSRQGRSTSCCCLKRTRRSTSRSKSPVRARSR